jgi:hypothetical protein
LPIHSIEWGLELHLRDQSCTPNEFLEVKLYAERQEYLPDLDYRHAGGDVAILLTNVKVSSEQFHFNCSLSSRKPRFNSGTDTLRP